MIVKIHLTNPHLKFLREQLTLIIPNFRKFLFFVWDDDKVPYITPRDNVEFNLDFVHKLLTKTGFVTELEYSTGERVTRREYLRLQSERCSTRTLHSPLNDLALQMQAVRDITPETWLSK